MKVLGFALAILLGHAGSAAAEMDRDRLVGSWSLVAYQLTYESEPPRDIFGSRPTGRIILTADGRMAAVIAAEGRTPATNDTERAALLQATIAYTGRYRLEGDRFVTRVDTAWNKTWEGTEQARDFRLDGDRLFIEARGTDPSRQGAPWVARLTWQREK
ncbi:lipocalin-like domain-containing protein [Falsiroseomonas sp. HC035]|uniref:lipocalin-like domain-containing protein n=1 Tax=Falsiroseomonas sp. HC035 TaxID=3390999 RepID=UPI003D3153D6